MLLRVGGAGLFELLSDPFEFCIDLRNGLFGLFHLNAPF
jgi:hypothetical protein